MVYVLAVLFVVALFVLAAKQSSSTHETTFGRLPKQEAVSTTATFASKCPSCEKPIAPGDRITKARLTMPDGKTLERFICASCLSKADNRGDFYL